MHMRTLLQLEHLGLVLSKFSANVIRHTITHLTAGFVARHP